MLGWLHHCEYVLTFSPAYGWLQLPKTSRFWCCYFRCQQVALPGSSWRVRCKGSHGISFYTFHVMHADKYFFMSSLYYFWMTFGIWLINYYLLATWHLFFCSTVIQNSNSFIFKQVCKRLKLTLELVKKELEISRLQVNADLIGRQPHFKCLLYF